MSKKRKITTREGKEDIIDRSKCFVCQDIKKEQLQCSFNTKKQNTDDDIKVVFTEIPNGNYKL